MATWSDIQTAISNFWNWLTTTAGSVTAGFTDKLGELGAWLFGGLKWLADQLYNGIVGFANWLYSGLRWIGDRLKEGYEALATWVSGGLQWIGSGLSWIGQQLYSFGQWLWNGICWVARTVANVVQNFVNWLWQRIVEIWNFIVGLIVSWIRGINDYLNDWIKSLRDKFKSFIAVNTTLPAVFKAYDSFVTNPNLKSLIGIFLSPVVGAITAELVDVIVPRPHSTRVIFFPEINIPTLEPTPIEIPLPPEPTLPPPTTIPTAPIQPPAVGYRPTVEKYSIVITDYEVYTKYSQKITVLNRVATSYEIATSRFYVVESENIVATEYDISSFAYKLLESENVVKAIPQVTSLFGTVIESENTIGTEIATSTSVWYARQVVNYVKTLYEVYCAKILRTELENLVKAIPELIPASIGVAMEVPVVPYTYIDVYLPTYTPPEQGGVGTEYELQVIHPSASLSSTNSITTEYEIGGTVVIALIEAIIYLGTTEYKKVETSHAFSEDFVIQGRLVVKYEPEEAMFEDWYISAGSSGEQSGGTTYIYARATNNVGTSYNVELT